MKRLLFDCNECGAPLEVSTKTFYLTCAHCSSRLKVIYEGGVYSTEILESVEKAQDRLASDVRKLKLNRDLRQIDKAWKEELVEHMHRDKKGRATPVGERCMVSSILIVVGGLLLVSLFQIKPGRTLPFLALCFLFGGSQFAYGLYKFRQYKERKSIYNQKRKAILAQASTETQTENVSACLV